MSLRSKLTISIAGPMLLFATGTDGGLAYFSPDTLAYQTQSEVRILWGMIPIYRSTVRDTDNELIDFIRQEGFVSAQQSDAERWELVYHWNHAWKDGQSKLYHVLIRHRREIIDWSKADPARARIYWTEGLRLLRSERRSEVSLGAEIFYSGWRCQSAAQLRELIAALKTEQAELDAGRESLE